MFYWNLLFYAKKDFIILIHLVSFNPCFIGTYSFTIYVLVHWKKGCKVLILVLLELTLLHIKEIGKSFNYGVLILVLLELTLLRYPNLRYYLIQQRFNPCFIGTYSFTISSYVSCVYIIKVLILVLLELTLLPNICMIMMTLII